MNKNILGIIVIMSPGVFLFGLIDKFEIHTFGGLVGWLFSAAISWVALLCVVGILAGFEE